MAWWFLSLLWGWFIWLNTGEWYTNPDYNYGWIVPVLALFFLYRNLKGSDLRSTPARPSWPGAVFLVLLCLIVLGLEMLRLSPATTRIVHWSAWLVVSGTTLLIVWNRFGFSGIRPFVFPCLFMATAVPWPSFAEQFLLNELAGVVARVVGVSFMTSGIYCQVSGNILEFAEGTVGIEEACSGLRLFQASAMCSLGLGEFFYLRWRYRIGLILLGSLIALLLNALRSYGLCWIFLAGGDGAVTQWHDTVGALTVVLLTLALLLIALKWERPIASGHSKSKLEFLGDLKQVLHHRRWPLLAQERVGVALLLLGFLSSQIWFWRGAGDESLREAFLTAELVDQERFRIEPLNDYEIEKLNPDASFRAVARRDDQPVWGAYYLYKRESPNPMSIFYHRPEVCLPGVGWEKVAEKPVVTTTLRGRPVKLLPIQFRHGQGESIWIYWAAWLHGEPFGFGAEGYGLAINRHTVDYIRQGVRSPAAEVFAFYTRQSPQGEIQDVKSLLDRLFVD
jgi:exosortase